MQSMHIYLVTSLAAFTKLTDTCGFQGSVSSQVQRTKEVASESMKLLTLKTRHNSRNCFQHCASYGCGNYCSSEGCQEVESTPRRRGYTGTHWYKSPNPTYWFVMVCLTYEHGWSYK